MNFILRNTISVIDCFFLILRYKTDPNWNISLSHGHHNMPFVHTYIRRNSNLFSSLLLFNSTIDLPNKVLFEKFCIKPLIRRSRMFHLLILFKTFHNLFDYPSILKMFDFHIPIENPLLHSLFYFSFYTYFQCDL